MQASDEQRNQCVHRVTVVKRNHVGHTIVHYDATILRRTEEGIVLHARWTLGARDLDYVVLRPDDHWIETFYTDRWYSLFEIRDAGWRLKGWYCNICRPAVIEPDLVAADDLALDLWVAASGSCRVLDEDEFLALSLNKVERREATSALVHLIGRARRRRPPFAALRGTD